jgi:hypothetical protein
MVGEVMRLRQLVLAQSRKPPAVESAIAVGSQHLLAELRAGIKAEKGNPNRLSLESLAAFNTAGWTESHSATMPTLRRLVHALQLPWGNAAEGVEPGNRGNRVKRLAAVSSALSSLMHAVNLNFRSQLGHLQSWGVYATTGSPLAVRARLSSTASSSTTEYAALLADSVDGGDNTTAGLEGLLRTTYLTTRPRSDGSEARAASVQVALPWLQEGAVSGVPPPADGAPPASYKPNSQSVQPIDANPGLYRNIAPLLEIQMQNAEVSGFVPPEELNRLWTWAGKAHLLPQAACPTALRKAALLPTASELRLLMDAAMRPCKP